MEIYIFGSLVRGDIDNYSDVDILILKRKNERLKDLNIQNYSIYNEERILQIWEEGNPFAWHLFLESKCIFKTSELSFFEKIGEPKSYIGYLHDLEKFYNLYLESVSSLTHNNLCTDFDASMIFLAVRNFASCFSLGKLKVPIFSRDSALQIEKFSLNIDINIYNNLRKSRILATRGIGQPLDVKETKEIAKVLPQIDQWFLNLINYAKG
ncbi:nucleotidyltransferase domain-containing protein [Sphingobacterium sp.]|uniref:nucleotidyltransferase domain-containing protein n=1 Tax=Sphingobacterium sp. TaxID=341027 RepID=UPI0031E1FF99